MYRNGKSIFQIGFYIYNVQKVCNSWNVLYFLGPEMKTFKNSFWGHNYSFFKNEFLNFISKRNQFRTSTIIKGKCNMQKTAFSRSANRINFNIEGPFTSIKSETLQKFLLISKSNHYFGLIIFNNGACNSRMSQVHISFRSAVINGFSHSDVVQKQIWLSVEKL